MVKAGHFLPRGAMVVIGLEGWRPSLIGTISAEL
jgi:hypothetical protein